MGFGLECIAALIITSSPQVRIEETPRTELRGVVVKSDNKTLYLQHEGLIVPLQVKPTTQIDGMQMSEARPLQEGEEVRASFTIDATQNVATKVERVKSKPRPSSSQLSKPRASFVPDEGGTSGQATPMPNPY
jgi:hypothetical protein